MLVVGLCVFFTMSLISTAVVVLVGLQLLLWTYQGLTYPFRVIDRHRHRHRRPKINRTAMLARMHAKSRA